MKGYEVVKEYLEASGHRDHFEISQDERYIDLKLVEKDSLIFTRDFRVAYDIFNILKAFHREVRVYFDIEENLFHFYGTF